MLPPPAIDIAELRRWIGREETREDLLTATLVDRFNATFDRVSPLTAGSVAPPLIHFCLCQAAAPTRTLGHDGHPPRGGFLPPAPLPRRMWVGGEVTALDELRIGDFVERRSIVTDVDLKDGRSGSLMFVSVRHEISRNGTLALRERQDLVYRSAETGGAREPSAPPPAPVAEDSRTVDPTSALLFRYSALTFNSHRIHFDTPYARDVESYPGLVVHGPLQATLLALRAAESKTRNPTHFSFRSFTPLSDRAGFAVNSRWNGDDLDLWTAAQGGPVAMKAVARW